MIISVTVWAVLTISETTLNNILVVIMRKNIWSNSVHIILMRTNYNLPSKLFD